MIPVEREMAELLYERWLRTPIARHLTIRAAAKLRAVPFTRYELVAGWALLFTLEQEHAY